MSFPSGQTIVVESGLRTKDNENRFAPASEGSVSIKALTEYPNVATRRTEHLVLCSPQTKEYL